MTRRESARKTLEAPPTVAATPTTAHRLEAELEFITPMFGGGVRVHPEESQRQIKEPDRVTPVRGASLRGQLREWWRRACCRELDLDKVEDLQRMKDRETVLWGWASAKGWVSITVDARNLKGSEITAFKINDRGNPDSLVGPELAYACFPLQGNRNPKSPPTPGTLTRWAGTFKVCLEVRPLEKEAQELALKAWNLPVGQLEDAMWREIELAWLAFVTFGGLGARTRRGFGAVKVKGRGATSLQSALERLEWSKRYKRIDKDFQGDANAAHKAAIGKLRSFRQAPETGRNPGQSPNRPGRSRWPEPDSIRRLTRTHDPQHPPEHRVDARYPRAAFGLPIIFHFKDRGDPKDQTLQPKGRERLASPLILRPVVDPDGKVHAVALRPPDLEDLNELLTRLELKGQPGTVCGYLTEPEQEEIRPLRENRSKPSKGTTAVFEPFFRFFEKP